MWNIEQIYHSTIFPGAHALKCYKVWILTYRSRSGSTQLVVVHFYHITVLCWRLLSFQCSAVTAGERVAIVGSMQNRKYEDQCSSLAERLEHNLYKVTTFWREGNVVTKFKPLHASRGT